MRGTPVDKVIFIPSLAVIAALIIPLVLDPEGGQAALGAILSFITGKLGWMFLLLTMAAFGVLIWLATGKYAHVKFGEPDDEPQFSTISWVGMLFCAGIGSGVLYWGAIEWVYYYTSPPFGAEPKSADAAAWASTYGLFHWGFSAWAIYCIPTIPMAYMLWNRKIRMLRLSQACAGVIGQRAANGLIGKIIDILFLFGLLGGVGTSLGLGTPMLSAAIGELLGIERDFKLDMAIVAVWTVIFGASVYSGLEKGIKRLSDVNLFLIAIVLIFMVVFGPTVFILDTFTNSLGVLSTNFLQMSFWTDPIEQSGFPQGWTIFYWAWWIAYGPFMGLFVARISKGRTIRQLVVAEIIGGSIGCWIFFAVIGNSGLYFEINDILSVSSILADKGAPEAIVAIFTQFPWGTALLSVVVVLAFIFLATTLDSAAFTMASVASQEMEDDRAEPARWHRLVWAVVLAGVALTLMNLGGLKALQTASLVVALPLVVVLTIMTISVLRWLKEDHADVDQIDLKHRIEHEERHHLKRPAVDPAE